MVIFLLLVGPAGGEELVGAQLDEPSLGFWLLPPDERLAFEDIPADPAPDPRCRRQRRSADPTGS